MDLNRERAQRDLAIAIAFFIWGVLLWTLIIAGAVWVVAWAMKGVAP